MKRKLLIQFILWHFFASSLYSQTLLVEYDYLDKQPTNSILASKKEFGLILNSEKSLYKLKNDKLLYVESDEKIVKNGVVREQISDDYVKVTTEEPQVFYKDIYKNSLIYSTAIFNKIVYVKEKLDKFNWIYITEKDSTFLNFKCKLAKTRFRGVGWDIYYTDELSFYGGPWKFNGLPGVVLYAESNDGNHKFEATSIQTKKETIKINNPFIQKETITWTEFTKTLKKKLQNIVKKAKAEDPDGDIRITLSDLIEDVGFTVIE
ncbi:MAG: GLPGLI family protein [Flavobacteriaceae bacterium]|nr:MAG: GLPGLI family protein [Flavobacteriaceae bacterium]